MGFQPTRRWRGLEPIFAYSPGSERGTGYTFTRSTSATCTSESSVITDVGTSTLRDAHYVLANDGITYRTTLLELQSTNLCLQSENFGATWTQSGTLTVGAQDSSIGVTLTLVGDNDGVAAALFKQTVGFTGDGVKAVSVFMKQGLSPAASGNRLIIQDTTAAASRLVAVVTWAAGVPTVTASTGTYIGKMSYGNGFYRLLFQTASLTAANTNQVWLYPANSSAPAETGDLYAGGVQVEDVAVPTSYLKTTTGTVSRSADVLYFPATDAPQEQTIYVKMVDRGTLNITNGGVIRIGSSSNAGAGLDIQSVAGTYRVIHNNGSANAASNPVAASAFADAVELRMPLGADGKVQLFQSLNAAAETNGALSAANALAAAWSDTRFYLGSLGSGAQGCNAIVTVKRLRGTRSLSQCRAA